MKIRAIAKSVKASLEKAPEPKEKDKKVSRKKTLSTGSTMLNLALSGDPSWGFQKGKYYLLVGESSAGKTFASMTCLAEAARNKHFDGYRFIYDNVEDGMLMDVPRLFGQKVEDRMEPPAKGKDGEPIFSETVEDFYFNLDDAVKEGKPFIYILDSMDSISSQQEEEKFDEIKEAARKGKETTGSYGDGKAKKNSTNIRKALKGVRKLGSILIIICQTRDNLASGPFGDPKSRSGGKALRFYATSEFWLTIVETIKKTVRGKQRKVGVKSRAQVKKNRQTGELHSADISIFPSYGIDDIGSCIDFLLEEGWWKKGSGGPRKKGEKKESSSGITAKEFGGTLSREDLIRRCEDPEEFEKLKGVVLECWNAIAKASKLERKPRYE